MYLIISCLIIHSLIFCDQFNYSNGKALYGLNVRRAARFEYPFLVSLQVGTMQHPNIFHICSGVLVSRVHVLFAEHCLEEQEFRYTVMYIKTQDRRNHAISWILKYNQWAGERNITLQYQLNDIAIIKLMQPVRNRIHPAVISNLPTNSLYGLNVTIASWNKFSTDESIIIEYGHVTILTTEQCEARCGEILGARVAMPHIMLCTAAEPHIIINITDSGGPLLYDGILIAMNGGSCPCQDNIHDPRKLNIHFSVDYYKDFIVDVSENRL